MARRLKRLTAVSVAAMKTPGRHADGGNLYLTISKTPDGLSKRWTFLFMLDGKQREAGFGPVSTVTLTEAREKARGWRNCLLDGVDPLAAKQASSAAASAAIAAAAKRRTFGQCADDFLKSKSGAWRSGKHLAQWKSTLAQHCAPIWRLPVDAIDTAAVLSVLKPVWQEIPETASRVRGRIDAVLNFAKAHGLRSGENPAAWRGHLALILPKRQKLSKGHHAALPYQDVPAFIAKLRETETIAALALEFTILTAARSGEALGARWAEIDLAAKVWTIPAARMKAGVEHRVPLSARAAEILESLSKYRSGDFVFPGHRIGCPIGATSLRKECLGAQTIHGFRSSFRDWAGNETNFPREVAEQALAHAIGDKSEQAYRRGDALEKRRALMEAWSSYCGPAAGGNVIALARTVP
jgi:integrase